MTSSMKNYNDLQKKSEFLADVGLRDGFREFTMFAMVNTEA